MILEQILQELQKLNANLGNIAPGAAHNAPAPVQQPAALTQAYVAPPVQQQPASDVTADQITALIQPHIGNEQIKTALGATMRSMGINALPETQPHQYGALFAAFQGVLAQHGVGGTVAPAASTSII